MKLFGTMKNNNGMLEVGGISVKNILGEFGSPLYIIDEKLLRDTCKVFKDNFKSKVIDTEVVYASKAFLNVGMAKLINEESLSMDVVSGGELYTAIKADFPSDKLYLHGNNKTIEELNLAIDNNIGTIVIDNIQEIENLNNILKSKNKKQNVLLRVNPGIDAHTHEYIQTTRHDSKFGESIYSSHIFETIKTINNSAHLNFKGIHCHIGSQVFEEKSFIQAAISMIDFAKDILTNTGITVDILNIGGGFGVYYTQEDNPMDLATFLRNLISKVEDKVLATDLSNIKLIIEPGRSIISNAGTTLYTIGGIKETYGNKDYIFIDGGMTDNPRPALYSAKYEASIANKLNDTNTNVYTIAGKCCESGDIVIKDIKLPTANVGDIVAVSSTGAYNYSMSSNYNRIPKPAVVFIDNGKGRVVVKRETYDDIIRNDVF